MKPSEQANPENPGRRCALTVAGSDSGGGAGIQADLHAFAAFGVHGTSVITAVTAQNTRGVSAFESVSAQLVGAQIEAVLVDFPIAAVKTGMLPDSEIIETVAHGLSGFPGCLVVDPVMVATSGDRLISAAAIEAIKQRLLPMCTLLTPNIPEAEMLAGMTIRTDADVQTAAARLRESGCRAVLLKGGHGSADTVKDLLISERGTKEFRHPRAPGDYHGTGCTLSAAITANLAAGLPLEDAVPPAIAYVQRAIAAAGQVGRGALYVLNHGVP